MSYTDPSGYFFKALGKFVKKYWKTIVAIAASYVTFGLATGAWSFAAIGNLSTAAMIGGGAAAGFVSGAISTGSLRGALQGAFSGALFGAIGGMGLNPGQAFAVSGLAGGVMADLQGGKFGHGFISAGVGAVAGGVFGKAPMNRIIGSAVVGGTLSKITGGKFANGALTAAFAAALRADWKGETANVGATEQSNTEENRKALQTELDQLAKDGTLSTKHAFDAADDAAKEVLNATAPLSKKYGLEVGGNIYQENGKYHYTMPQIGDGISVPMYTDWIGYHTHPSGGMYFSNSFNTAGGGNDALWVQKGGNPLYMGVQLTNGSIGIAVCEPGSCSNIGRFGTKGRTVQ